MYQEIIDLLKCSKYTLGCAESFTGGLFASTITSYSGVSSFFKGGIVTYWNEVKEKTLKVNAKTIKQFGVVSKETALEMAKNVKDILNVDIAVSFTGNAGPNVLEDKPCGRVYICVCFLDNVEVYELTLSGCREDVRKQAVAFAFEKIKINLEKLKKI